MHTGTKSDILQCFLEDILVSHTSPETTASVLDDAIIVQNKCWALNVEMLQPSKTMLSLYSFFTLLSGFIGINV